jgi:hypothetical protein
MAVSLCLFQGSGDVVCVEHTRSARAAATRVTKWITPDKELYTGLKGQEGANNAQRVKLLWLASLQANAILLRTVDTIIAVCSPYTQNQGSAEA